MSDDNGFVERPADYVKGSITRPGSIASRLRETAKNGKAIQMKKPTAGAYSYLKGEGLSVHYRRQPDGSYLVWAERVEATP